MCRSNYWLQTVLLDKDFSNLRDLILKSTNETGLITRPVWKLMNELTMFENCPKMDLSVAKSLSERLINIPSSASL